MLQAGTTTFPAKWVKGNVNLAQSGGRRMELSIHWEEASQSQARESQGHHNHNQPTAHRTHRGGTKYEPQAEHTVTSASSQHPSLKIE